MNNLTKQEMIIEISEILNYPIYHAECLNKLNKHELECLHYHTVRDSYSGRMR